MLKVVGNHKWIFLKHVMFYSCENRHLFQLLTVGNLDNMRHPNRTATVLQIYFCSVRRGNNSTSPHPKSHLQFSNCPLDGDIILKV